MPKNRTLTFTLLAAGVLAVGAYSAHLRDLESHEARYRVLGRMDELAEQCERHFGGPDQIVAPEAFVQCQQWARVEIGKRYPEIVLD